MSIREISWFRRLTLVIAVCFLAALVVLTVAHLRGRKVARVADPQAIEALEGFEKPVIPDDKNAAKWLAAGAGAVVWSTTEMAAVGTASGVPFSEWDPETEAAVRAALNRHRGALDTMRTAIGLEDSNYDIHYSDGTEAELPELLELIRAARLLVSDARVAFAGGDPEAGMADLETINRMATSLYEESTLITYLVAVAIERIMLVQVAEAVSFDDVWACTAGFLDELEAVVPRTDQMDDLRRVLRAWDATLWAAATKGVTRWEVDPKGSLELPDDLGREDVQKARRRIEEWLSIPYGRTPERLTQLEAEAEAQEPDNGVETDVVGFYKAIGRAQSVAAQRQLVRAAIAMRRSVVATGSYPSDRPEYPGLTDPDPFTDRRLSYEPGSDGSLTLEVVGLADLLTPITVGGMSRYVRPITLPAPS